MKKQLFLSISILAVASSCVAPVLFKIGAKEVQAAASGYTNSKLTKTIDLNPVSETEIRSYYSSLDGKNLQGEDLLKALKPILKNGQQYHSYDSGSSVWQAYEITDRDWTLSPASSTTYGTYDATKNIITDYEYGSNSSPKNNPYQHLFYRNRGVEDAKWRAWDHHGDNKGTDREHIWPKSRGFGKDDTNTEIKVAGARGDLHHLVAGDSYVNSSTHSNNSYGFVDMSTVTDNAGESFKINGSVVVAGNYRGKALNIADKSAEVFEPQDCDKGDIARACFYMVARYNNLAGDDNAIDAGNPNLTLNDEISTATVYSTATKAVSIGILRDLLAWHKLDPVDEYEIHRNDLIYRNYDKNRNPFIDFPEWVDAIWGTVELNADNRTIKSRNASPKGVAKPANDKVYTKESSSAEEPSSSALPSASSAQPSSQSTLSSASSSSAAPVISSSASSEGGNTGLGGLPMPVLIGVIAGAVVILIIVIVIAVKGKGKARKAARKALKSAAKGATKSSKSKKRK